MHMFIRFNNIVAHLKKVFSIFIFYYFTYVIQKYFFKPLFLPFYRVYSRLLEEHAPLQREARMLTTLRCSETLGQEERRFLVSGTGKTKPYVDKKHFFQELKNPPKKVLNDLMEKRSTQSGLLEAKASSVFNSDPFGEDPFDKTDPFSDSDPFDTTSFTDDKVSFRLAVLVLALV